MRAHHSWQDQWPKRFISRSPTQVHGCPPPPLLEWKEWELMPPIPPDPKDEWDTVIPGTP